MVPDRGFGALYVTLEGETMLRLARRAGIPMPEGVSFVGSPSTWNTMFHLNRVRSKHDDKDPDAAFFPGRSIKTDGVACSVVMYKRVPTGSRKRKRGDDDALPEPTTVKALRAERPGLSDRVVAIDPGKKPDVLVGVVRSTASCDEQVFKVSVKEWRERAGFNKRSKVSSAFCLFAPAAF